MANVTTYVPPTKYVDPYVPKFGDIYLEKLKREEDAKQREIQNAQMQEQLLQRKEEAERNDAVSLQRNTLSMIQNLSDPESVKRVVGSYNKQPLIQKFQLNLPEDGLTMPTKTATDPLNKEMAAIKAQDPTLTDAQARLKAGQLYLKKSEPTQTFEKESEKARVQSIVKTNDEITASRQSISNIETAREQINDMADVTGNLIGVKTIISDTLQSLGLSSDWTNNINDTKLLGKSLGRLALSKLKSTFTGAQSDAEGRKMQETIGSESDPKQVLKNNLDLMAYDEYFKMNNAVMRSALLQNPENFSKAEVKINRYQDFPKVMAAKNRKTGNIEIVSFYDVIKEYRADNPDMQYTDLVQEWLSDYNRIKNVEINTPKWEEKDIRLLNENF